MSLKGRSRLYFKLSISSALLIAAGSAVVLSSSIGFAISQTGSPTYFFEKHIIWLLLGGIAMLLAGKLGVRNLDRRGFILFLISLGILLLPGRSRWFHIGTLSVQPSEFVKLTFIVFLAGYLAGRKHISTLRSVMIPAGFLFFITVVLQLQSDLGTFVIIFCLFSLLLFLAGLPKRYLMTVASAGVVIATVLILISPYRINRVRIFLNPGLDPQGKGYQPLQSQFALASGGLFGKGIGVGGQKLKYLPEAHKDYVYAVIGEETGLVGATAVLFLFGMLVFSGFEVGMRARTPFEKYLACGISGMFGFQFLLHASVVLSLVPSKGTTLPFFSVGGSALVTNLVALGILLEIARNTCFLTPLEELEEHVIH